MAVGLAVDSIEEVARLVAAGRTCRDGWLPVAGSLDSGFRTPTSPVPDLTLASGGDPHAELTMLRRLTADPLNRAVATGSSGYPTALAVLHGRPAVLYVRGHNRGRGVVRLGRPAVAVVGNRHASELGRSAAYDIARELTRAGQVVVSGLAAGVDTAAHRGALDAGGTTVAVMGTGLGHVFPSENERLAEQIAERGALVTQFPPASGPTKTSFPARNALIAGLSQVSVLVEMSEGSGTMIEARCALAQRKHILLWEPILGDQDWARRFVIDNHARFVSSVTDILRLTRGS